MEENIENEQEKAVDTTPCGNMSVQDSQPVSKIRWLHTSWISANDYNPNVVFDKELTLLEHSILKNGWLHPIIVCSKNACKREYEIIDGFHRYSLSKLSKKLIEIHSGYVPAVVLDISEADRMLLTIRINRAKGTHMAFKMADIIKTLIDTHGLTSSEVAQGIGAGEDEVKILYENSIFKRLDLQNHKYSKAWRTKE